uniref:ShKT domain-containing protein n=2 Tax=Strongyloides stercoralis TaxID=6248 RepID=A0A0K0EIQ7_STRER
MKGIIFFYFLLINCIDISTSTANCYYPSTTIDNTCVNNVIDTVTYSKCTQGAVTLHCLENADDNNFVCCSDNADPTMVGLEIIQAVAAFTQAPLINGATTVISSNSPQTCVDLSRNCNLYKNFCNLNRYQVICPNTCNSCGVTYPPLISVSKKDDCKDLSNNCNEMAMYCQDSTYINMMASVCAATCQKCGDPSTWNNNTMVFRNPKTDKCKSSNNYCGVKTIYCQIFSC